MNKRKESSSNRNEKALPKQLKRSKTQQASATKYSGTRSDPRLSSIIEKAYDAAYGSLKLDELEVKKEVGVTSTRNHTNPLSAQFQVPLEPPQDWKDVFHDPSCPLFIDVGCGPGRFGITAAKHSQWKDYNHLGFEIRAPFVTRANAWVERLKLKNCRYVVGSANVSLERYVSNYPGPIRVVAVQFPDPHFKKKHHKRRVLQPDLIKVFAKLLQPEGQLFIQSDVEEIAAEMRDRLALSPYFNLAPGKYSERSSKLDIEKCAKGEVEELWTNDGKRSDGGNYGGWPSIDENPFGVPTEREVQNKALQLPIYRALFIRNKTECSFSDKEIQDAQTSKLKSLLITVQVIEKKFEFIRRGILKKESDLAEGIKTLKNESEVQGFANSIEVLKDQMKNNLNKKATEDKKNVLITEADSVKAFAQKVNAIIGPHAEELGCTRALKVMLKNALQLPQALESCYGSTRN